MNDATVPLLADGIKWLGYYPKQNSEDYAAEILSQPNPLSDIGQRYQGGSFAAMDFTATEDRPVRPR